MLLTSEPNRERILSAASEVSVAPFYIFSQLFCEFIHNSDFSNFATKSEFGDFTLRLILLSQNTPLWSPFLNEPICQNAFVNYK